MLRGPATQADANSANRNQHDRPRVHVGVLNTVRTRTHADVTCDDL